MTTAKIFKHGGSQAIRLPKAFRVTGDEVQIEKRGDEIVLKPLTKIRFDSFSDIARYLADRFPDSEQFPEPPPRPTAHERNILEL